MTANEVASWLNQHPDQAAIALGDVLVAGPWERDEQLNRWSRWRLVRIGDDLRDELAQVCWDPEFSVWLVSLADVEHEGEYLTDDEARAAADTALHEDGYALVGGRHG